MKALSRDQVLRLHEALIDRFGGEPGVRNAGLLESALARPFAEFDGVEAHPEMHEKAAKKLYPYSMPPASREYTYGGDTCPAAQQFLKTFIRWSTFCEKYDPEHCELAASIVREVADRNRR